MSSWIIIVFIVEFALIAIIEGYRCNFPMSYYGLGGAILNVGILLMQKGT